MKKNLLVPALIAALMVSCQPEKTVEPSAGELEYRLNMTVERITKGELPKITKDFLLAGLTLDPKFERRFTNYSGDQEGRYLSAMSLIDNKLQSIDIHDLVKDIIANQKADGRFGADSLSFSAKDMNGPQMALLWGNGRLLTGLMDYYNTYPEHAEALNSARFLGDFLGGVTNTCTQPEIIERFKTMGALGFICFTQITEGMVKLYVATHDEKYRKVAELTYPLLPEFGNQHSHGYLNTLRGVVMLYEATKDSVHLKYSEKAFDEIVKSDNYMVTGGIPEFFGFFASEEGVRDEGCSEADFFILCLQLWKATGNSYYLEKAEYMLANHMLYNQYKNGSFGHHVIKNNFGFITSHIPGQSWWCCNYHGVHAIYDAQEVVVTRNNTIRQINLFYPTHYEDNEMAFDIVKNKGKIPSFTLTVNKTDNESALAIRNPEWSSKTEVLVNGKAAETSEKDGYLHINTKLKKGDKVSYSLQPVLRLVTQRRISIPADSLKKPLQNAALVYGPWLMSADDVFQELFMNEQSLSNIIYLPGNQANETDIPDSSFNPEAYLSFTFLKTGTSQKSTVVLRPISEVSFQGPSNVRFWFNFEKSN